MTTNANWLNIDPIEDETDPPPAVIQPSLKERAQKLGVANLGGTVWFGQQSAPKFSLSVDVSVKKSTD